MEKLFLTIFIVLGCSITVFSQDRNATNFSYDKGGNMVQRQIQVLPPIGGRFAFHTDTIVKPTQLNFKIYPNPTNQYLNIEGELPENIKEANIEIINSTGQLLRTDKYEGVKKTMDVSDLKSGMYLLEIIYTKKEKSTYKIIISN